MKRALIPIKAYEQVGQRLDWADQTHYQLMLTGEIHARHYRSEHVLPLLVKRHKLVAVMYDGRLVYAVPRICRGNFQIEHGLGVSECKVRLWRADPDGLLVPTRELHGRKSIPDGILMHPGSLVLIEFHTNDNFMRHKPSQKVAAYEKNLGGIEGHFQRSAVVLFVIDALLEEVRRLSVKHPDGYYYFVDYETFKSVPLGQQLTAPVYFLNGERTALRDV